MLLVSTDEDPAEAVDQPLRDASHDAAAGGRQDQQELVAAEARQHIAGPQHIAQAAGRLLQHPVADIVAEAVVDLLEAVEVEIKQGEGLGRAVAPARRHRSAAG